MIYCKEMAEPLFLTLPIINIIYEQINTISLLGNIFIRRKGKNFGWTETSSVNYSIFAIVQQGYAFYQNSQVILAVSDNVCV